MSRIRWIAPVASGWLILSVLVLAGWTPVAQAAPADHLLISEVVTQARFDPHTGRQLGSKFIEVVNPTAGDIDLSDVYLTDGTFAGNNVYYWQITDGLPGAATAGGGKNSDFHGRFPDGYVLAAGDTLAISVAGSNEYFAAYGRQPDFELFEDARVPDAVPELEPVFPGSIHGGDALGETDANLLPDLDDGAESLILYRWDGTSDLVTDIDFMYWGSSPGVLFDKTGVTIGGSSYRNDTPVGSQEPVSTASAGFLKSYARLSADEGTETATGGNGVGGNDETSENLGTTWEIAAAQDPPQAPATPFASAPIIIAGSQSPDAPADGQDATLSVDVASNSAVTGVAFLYTVDGGSATTLTGSDEGSGNWTAVLPGQSVDAVVEWWAVVTNADGRSATWPAVAPTFTEGWTVSTAPDPGDFPAKLLITEVATIGTDQEFVEIYNPGDTDVEMDNYFLTDAIYAPGSQFYWRITEGNPNQTTIGGGGYADFHSQFPVGFTIAAGDTIVVSVGGSQLFAGAFGFLPDLELWEDDAFPDNVPDMRWVFGDETNNSIINRTGANPSTPTLSNAAETVILYNWDGISDGVTDIDVFNWKDPSSTSTSFFFSKTGVTVGTHSYLPDTPTTAQTPFPQQADFGFSYQRVDAGEGTQHPSGSNGVDGRDETSENLPTTFELAEYDPSRPSGGGSVGGGAVALLVEAKTFLPYLGEKFPIRFVSKPRSETKLRLFDQKGRLVLTLFDSRFNGSPSTLPDAPTVVVWDGLDNTFQRVRAGMYIVHLSVVNNATGEEETKTAPVVVATRLSN